MNDATDRIEVIPSGGALGAEIRGLDLCLPLDAATVGRLRRALLDHCVLVFRDQIISEEDQVRFTGCFGRPVEHVRRQPDRRVKEIFLISNIEQNGQPIGALGHGELSFHSDLSYLRRPGTLSLLYAVEVPESGGSTQWCNGYAAYEALDDGLKARVHGLRAIHRHPVEEQNPARAGGPPRRAHPPGDRPPHAVRRPAPDALHSRDGAHGEPCAPRPAVRTHDPTPFRVDPPLAGRDLVMWDNRATLHRREPFPADQRRLMKRTQVLGEEVPS